MTVKASTLQTSAEYEPSVHNGLWNVRSCMKFSVIIFILHLIAAPSILISAIYNITNHIDSTPSESTYFIAAGATFFAGALGILIAFMNFGCLYNKNKADMYLSAPLSMKQRFFSDYISGLASYIIPFIAAQIPTLILFAVGHFGLDGKEFKYLADIIDDSYTYYTCDFFENAFPIYCRYAVGGILAMIMLYTLTVLIMTCCGTFFDSIVHTVLINFFSPFAFALTFDTIYKADFMLDLNRFFYPIFAWTSPAGAVAMLLIMGIGDNLYGYNAIPFWEWSIGVIANIAVTFALAYHFYKKRRAEQITKPIVFRWIYALMITLGLCFAIIVSVNLDLIFVEGKFDKKFFTVVFVTFLIYMLCEIISNRGMKKLWKGAVRYVITFAAYTACLALVFSTRFFGVEYYVPSADEVEKIYLGYSGAYYDNIYNTFDYYSGDGSDGSVLVIENRDSIENIIAAQRISASVRKTALKNGGTDGWLEWLDENGGPYNLLDYSVCCVLKSGRRVTRTYIIVTAEAEKYLMTIDASEEYKKQAAQNLKNRFEPYDELYEWLRTTQEQNKKNGAVEDISVDLYLYTPISSWKNDGMYAKKIKMNESFYNELRDALAADREALTADEYFRPCSDRKYSISVTHILWGLPIDGSWTETMKVLAAHNCFDALDDDLDELLDESNREYTRTIAVERNSESSQSSLLYRAKEGVLNKEYYGGLASDSNIRYVVHYSEDLRKLVEVMQFRYITDEVMYSIRINGNSYPIPPEYSDIAERVFESAEKLSDYPDGTDLYYGIGAVASNS